METTSLDMFKQTIVFEKDNIWVKPVCDFFNLDVRNQHKRIKNDPILKNLVGKNTPDLSEIDNNGRILLSKKGFLRWIQIINANTINPQLKPKFIIYQSLIFDFLYGSIEHDEQMRLDYSRLKKLRALYGKIGREIQRTESNVKLYLDTRFTQLSLNFGPLKQLKN